MIRRTKQRAAILQAIVEAARPLAPAEIHQLARRHCPQLGLRTVYRNLGELTAAGRLAGVDYPGQPVRYEPITDKAFRPHFVCQYCRKTYNLEDPVRKIPYNAPPGFLIEGEEVVFYGRCPACQSRSKTSRK